ncbi:MAG: hypothetical protein ACK5I7_07070, partial [Anaerotignum sp.]
MGDKKATTILTFLLIGIALTFLIFLSARENNGIAYDTSEVAYAEKVFGDEVMDINIIADQSVWDEMIAAADKEVYYACDVVLNGERINNVGIRVKGNSSLSTIRNDDT